MKGTHVLHWIRCATDKKVPCPREYSRADVHRRHCQYGDLDPAVSSVWDTEFPPISEAMVSTFLSLSLFLFPSPSFSLPRSLSLSLPPPSLCSHIPLPRIPETDNSRQRIFPPSGRLPAALEQPSSSPLPLSPHPKIPR